MHHGTFFFRSQDCVRVMHADDGRLHTAKDTKYNTRHRQASTQASEHARTHAKSKTEKGL